MVQVGDEFDSMDSARSAIRSYILDQGESFKAIKSEKKLFVLVCKDPDCGFRIRCIQSSKGVIKITKMQPHSCSPVVHYKNRQSQSVNYLLEHHRASILDNPKIKARQVRSNERLQFSNDISYLQAYRTIQAALNEMYGNEAESFAKFPAYATRFKAADPDNYCKIQTHKDTGHFQAAFFALASTRHAQKSLREFVGIDGTHTSSRFRMNLLILGSIDANNEVLPLAWALVPIECEAWWTWFLKHCNKAFDMQIKGFVFMSDREKGLPNALKAVFPDASLSYCCQYIADNIQAEYGIKCRPLFWKCARAKTKEAFEVALQDLQSLNVDAADYVTRIPYEFWARHIFPSSRSGHDTNNIIESINSAWSDIRQLPPLRMMDAIYTTIMETVYNRFRRLQRSTTLADIPLAKFNDRSRLAKRYRVVASGNSIYQVQIPESGKNSIVNLKEPSCDCTNFHEYRSPCTHAIAACQYDILDPFQYFYWKYTVEAYRKTYEHFVLPMNVEDLPSEQGVLPPVFKKQRGRPLTKRIRKGAWKRKQKKCSNCYELGHNRRKCRSAPAYNGRQQRARDRELSISSSSSSSRTSSSNIDSDSDSNSDSDSDSDRAELDRYDTQVAEAWRIHNKYHDDPTEKDSGSELSVLASSQFNGMEGIEIGSASEVQGNIGSSSTVFGGNNEIKVSRYGRVLKKKTK